MLVDKVLYVSRKMTSYPNISVAAWLQKWLLAKTILEVTLKPGDILFTDVKLLWTKRWLCTSLQQRARVPFTVDGLLFSICHRKKRFLLTRGYSRARWSALRISLLKTENEKTALIPDGMFPTLIIFVHSGL